MNAFLYTLKGDIHVGSEGELCHAHHTVSLRQLAIAIACDWFSLPFASLVLHTAGNNFGHTKPPSTPSLQVTLTREEGQGGIVIENKSEEPAEFVLIAGP